jgi:hypothetical protein
MYFVRFELRMGEILNLKWFSSLKIQINHKKQILDGKISWEHGYTWRSTIQLKYEQVGCAYGIVGKITIIKV